MKRPLVLSKEEIFERLKNSMGWKLEDGTLQKEFYFSTYLDGARTLIEIAQEAEGLDHHPELTLGYRKLLVKTSTHEPSGITELDFVLLGKIEIIVRKAV